MSFENGALFNADRTQKAIEDRNHTELTQRDYQMLIKLLDDENAKPNPALVAAARKYKRR